MKLVIFKLNSSRNLKENQTPLERLREEERRQRDIVERLRVEHGRMRRQEDQLARIGILENK